MIFNSIQKQLQKFERNRKENEETYANNRIYSEQRRYNYYQRPLPFPEKPKSERRPQIKSEVQPFEASTFSKKTYQYQEREQNRPRVQIRQFSKKTTPYQEIEQNKQIPKSVKISKLTDVNEEKQSNQSEVMNYEISKSVKRSKLSDACQQNQDKTKLLTATRYTDRAHLDRRFEYFEDEKTVYEEISDISQPDNNNQNSPAQVNFNMKKQEQPPHVIFQNSNPSLKKITQWPKVKHSTLQTPQQGSLNKAKPIKEKSPIILRLQSQLKSFLSNGEMWGKILIGSGISMVVYQIIK